MRLIVGLGNPGLRYAHTRHNIGFDILDLFAKEHGARIRRRWCRALVADARIMGEEFILAKPQTFMNSSGEAVREICMRAKIDPSAVMVVCDDVNLELGRLRLRPHGSSGGHHGLESIISCLRSQEFARLRIGVGEGPNQKDVVDHVLSRFHKRESDTVADIQRKSVDCLNMTIAEGIEKAMNRFNSWSAQTE